MDDLIKITPDLDISFFDLMSQVDLDCEFTLKDVLRAAVKSSYIPVKIMAELLQCRCLEDYYNEACSKPFEATDNDIDYLELYYLGDVGIDKKASSGMFSSSQWAFHGVGKLGVIPDEDVRPIAPELKASYRETYGIELTPLYNLADYKIKIGNQIVISDWREKDYDKQIKKIDFRPSITLIELLYSICWELSFFGSPEMRDGEKEELKSRLDKIDEAKKNGTLDQILTTWEEAKDKIIKKFGNIGKTNKEL